MSYLLTTLGRGLVSRMETVFGSHFPRASNDTTEALQERLTHSPRSVDLALRLGRQYLSAGRLSEARLVFEGAHLRSEAPRLCALGLACVCDELGASAQAVEHLKVARRIDPRDPAAVYALALSHERAGALGAARSAYRSALAICPRLRNAYERLAAIAVREGDWDEALACYEQLGDLAGEELDTLLLLGTLYLQNDQPHQAFERFQIALLIEPEDGEGHLLPESDGRTAAPGADALRTLERLVAKYPALATYRVRLGDLYARRGADQEALREYQAAVTLQPNFLEATVKLGTQHLRSGRLVAAAQTFNHATELNDRLTFAFVAMGEAQRRAGCPAEGAATLDLAASVEPSSTLLLSETTRLHLKAVQNGHLSATGAGFDDSEEADRNSSASPPVETTLEDVVQRHRRALAAQRGRADLHYRYGVLLRQCGRTREAVESFRQAAELNPNFTKALLKLGLGARELGDETTARESFDRALTIRPEAIAPHYQLGLLFTQPNKFELALEDFTASGELRNGCSDGLRGALENVGLLDGVTATWRTLTELAMDPDDVVQRRREALSLSI